MKRDSDGFVLLSPPAEQRRHFKRLSCCKRLRLCVLVLSIIAAGLTFLLSSWGFIANQNLILTILNQTDPLITDDLDGISAADGFFTVSNVVHELRDSVWNSTFAEMIGDYNDPSKCWNRENTNLKKVGKHKL